MVFWSLASLTLRWGEDILTEVGQIIRTRGGNNGKLSLRAGLTLAALDEEGLSLINFMRYLPTDMQIDLDQAQTLSQTVERVIQTQRESIDTLASLAADESAAERELDYASLPNLTETGSYEVENRRIVLNDASRSRTFYVDIYQPQSWRPGASPCADLFPWSGR